MNESGTKNSRNSNGSRFDQLFYGSIVVGIIIVGISILANKHRWIGLVESRLILCSGLGILLGAFGSTAIIKYRGFVIAGVAALAIALSYVIVDVSARTLSAALKGAIFGNISGDIQHATVEVYSGITYYGALGSKGKEYDFVVYGRIDKPVVYVDITFRDGEGKALGSDPLVIESRHINDYVGTGEKITWKYIKDEHVIKDHHDNVIGKIDKRSANYLRRFLKSCKAWFLPSPVFAETQRGLRDIFDDLTSESAKVRREARSELAAKGPSAVGPMMEEFKEHQNIYRIRLGVLVALTEMLRKDKGLSPEVRKQLSSKEKGKEKENLKLIVKALNDSDRTIRIYAGEFLFDLGDPQVVPLALESAKTSYEEGRYQSIFVIKGAFQELPREEKSRVKRELEQIRLSSGEKTKALIDDILHME